MSHPTSSKSLFEELRLSPLASEAEIAERLKELVVDADDARRTFLRDAFDQLTRSPRARFELAMRTFLEEPVAELPSLPAACLPDHESLRVSAAGDGGTSATAAWIGDDESTREMISSPGSGYVPLLEDPIVSLIEDPFLVRYVKRRTP